MFSDKQHFWKLAALLAVIVMAAFSYILYNNPDEVVEEVHPEAIENREIIKYGN
mgnify:CR=1 FL=1